MEFLCDLFLFTPYMSLLVFMPFSLSVSQLFEVSDVAVGASLKEILDQLRSSFILVESNSVTIKKKKKN